MRTISGEVTDEELEDFVFNAIRPQQDGPSALPYLFIGSGLSMRYLGLPTWRDLLDNFAKEAGLDLKRLLIEESGDLPSVASRLVSPFSDVWFDLEKYAAQRAVPVDAPRDDLPLKRAVSDLVRQATMLTSGVPGVENAEYAAEISLLSKALVDGVITTNYDLLAEQIFPDFKAFVGQDDLIMSSATFVSEIYHIHGTCKVPASLVLTSEDYEHVSARSRYLIAKLLTIFVEHPVVFLGYSFSDGYIQGVFQQVAEAVTPSRLRQLGDRLVFVEWERSADQPATVTSRDIALNGGGSLPITSIRTHSFAPVFRALGRLERPFPEQLLRQLAPQIYELFADGTVKKTPVAAVPIDSPSASGLKVVFGVGEYHGSELDEISDIGLRHVDRDLLGDDLLGIRSLRYSPALILERVIPTVHEAKPTAYLPVYKYLRDVGRVTADGVSLEGVPAAIGEIIATNARIKLADHERRRIAADTSLATRSLAEIAADPSLAFSYRMTILIAATESGDLDDVLQALRAAHGEVVSGPAVYQTYFWRALCSYDAARYGVVKQREPEA